MTSTSLLDIKANRSDVKWSKQELMGRACWGIGQRLFRYSPRLMWSWRRWLLRLFGARVGNHVHIHPTVTIFIPWNLSIGDFSSIGFDALIYNLGPVTIGQRATISHRAHLCAGSHDHCDATMPLLKLPIHIGNDAWVCADAFVGPNVIVGDGAVVGARAAVFKNVQLWTVVGGNPAQEIGPRVLSTKHE